jgi:hypothetical protein
MPKWGNARLMLAKLCGGVSGMGVGDGAKSC